MSYYFIMKESNGYVCKICKKHYESYQSLWNHNKKKHNIEIEEKEHICNYCNKNLSCRQSKWRHEKTCNDNSQKNVNTINIHILKDKFQPVIQTQQPVIQTQQPVIQTQQTQNKLFHMYEIPNSDLYVLMRVSDCYVNATQLCNICKKIFAHWYYTDKTQKSIGKITIEKHNSSNLIVKPLVEVTNFPDFSQEFWICPDLALDLTKWISPILSIQLNQWIKSHNTTWSDSKKQPREQYSDKPVLYLITNEGIKQKNVYIIGKSNNLTNRLSVYNKTAEHEVVYYKSCNNEENMNLIEVMVLNKLKIYKERANRDRFILPESYEISLFIKVVNEVCDLFNDVDEDVVIERLTDDKDKEYYEDNKEYIKEYNINILN